MKTRRVEADAELAARLVLLGLGGIGPRRGHWLLGGDEKRAIAAVAALRERRLPVGRETAPAGVGQALLDQWFAEVRRLDGPALLAEHRNAGIRILGPDDAWWPFHNDPDPPLLLFATGHVDGLAPDAGPRVAVVGTRRCTTVGRRVAYSLGADLTAHQVPVVSGLALGIDGAAHLGAISAGGSGAPPVAVVASGLDRVYPPGNTALWQELSQRGLLLSEAPLGTPPQRWRFPARNRLIAALAALVVVVESHERGGALLTVDEAAERGVPVAVVPGSVLSAASNGTNALLLDGCAPVRNATDVLDLLPLRAGRSPAVQFEAVPLQLGFQPDLDELSQSILEQLGAGEIHLDHLVAVTGCSIRDVVRSVGVLVDRGLAEREGNRVR